MNGTKKARDLAPGDLLIVGQPAQRVVVTGHPVAITSPAFNPRVQVPVEILPEAVTAEQVIAGDKVTTTANWTAPTNTNVYIY